MRPELEIDRVLMRSPEIFAAEIGGDFALMSRQNGRYYALNSTASQIWRELEYPSPVGRIAASLSQQYSGDQAQIEADLRQTLQEWLEQRLITVTSADPR